MLPKKKSLFKAHAVALLFLHHLANHVDGEREDDGRVLLGTDGVQGLQVSQLHGVRGLTHDVSSLLQLARCVHLPLSSDDLYKHATSLHDNRQRRPHYSPGKLDTPRNRGQVIVKNCCVLTDR